MNRTRYDFFAGSGLAKNQGRPPALRKLFHHPLDVPQTRRLADQEGWLF